MGRRSAAPYSWVGQLSNANKPETRTIHTSDNQHHNASLGIQPR